MRGDVPRVSTGRGRGSCREGLRLTSRLAGVAILVALGTRPIAAQSIGGSIAPGLLVDGEAGGDGRAGPALSLAITTESRGPVSYGLFIVIGRTDFMVASKSMHRNWGSAAIAGRIAATLDGASVGLILGAGVHGNRDVAEDGVRFGDSGRGGAMFMPGIDLRMPVGDSWGITVLAMDKITEVLYALFDPSEYDLGHQFVFGVGVHFR